MEKLCCSSCGCDLTKNGIIIDAVQTAHYNEETGEFVYDNDFWTMETKCPECYSIGGIPNVQVTSK